MNNNKSLLETIMIIANIIMIALMLKVLFIFLLQAFEFICIMLFGEDEGRDYADLVFRGAWGIICSFGSAAVLAGGYWIGKNMLYGAANIDFPITDLIRPVVILGVFLSVYSLMVLFGKIEEVEKGEER